MSWSLPEAMQILNSARGDWLPSGNTDPSEYLSQLADHLEATSSDERVKDAASFVKAFLGS